MEVTIESIDQFYYLQSCGFIRPNVASVKADLDPHLILQSKACPPCNSPSFVQHIKQSKLMFCSSSTPVPTPPTTHSHLLLIIHPPPGSLSLSRRQEGLTLVRFLYRLPIPELIKMSHRHIIFLRHLVCLPWLQLLRWQHPLAPLEHLIHVRRRSAPKDLLCPFQRHSLLALRRTIFLADETTLVAADRGGVSTAEPRLSMVEYCNHGFLKTGGPLSMRIPMPMCPGEFGVA